MKDLPGHDRALHPMVLLAALLVLATGCGGRGNVNSEVSLLPLPEVDLDHLDEKAARALESARAEVDGAARGAPGSHAEAFGQLGMLYQAHALPKAAEVCYRNSALLEPEEIRWPYYLGHLYRSVRDHPASLESFEAALALDSRYPALLFHLGDLYLEQNRLAEAREVLERALELDEGSAAVRFGMGRLLIAEGTPALAVEHLEAALRLAPEADRTHYLLGLAYRDLGEAERAREHLDRAGLVKPNPEDPLMAAVRRLEEPGLQQRLRGVIALEEGRYAEAAEELQHAVQKNPEDPIIRLNLGMAWASLGRLEEAEAELLESLRRGTEDRLRLTAHHNLGNLYTLKGSQDEARTHYEAALEIDPGHLQVRSDLGLSLYRLGRLEEAVRVFQTLLELDPERPGTYLALSMTLNGMGRFEATRDLLEEGHARLPAEARIAGALAELLATCRDPAVRDGDRAVQLARSLWQRMGTPPYATVLAMALAEQGDFERAISLQRGAIQAAARGGQSGLVARWQSHLQAYERGEPVRLPALTSEPPG